MRRCNCAVKEKTYVQASHILVEARDSAVATLDMINGGLAFHLLAFRWSEHRGSAEIGGQLPVVRCEEYPAEFASFVCAAELRKPRIVKTESGWHVVVVNSRSTDVTQVAEPNPALQPEKFTETITLSCSFSAVAGSLTVKIDEPKRMAFVGDKPALLIALPVEFRLRATSGSTVVIDRTTGEAVVHEPGKPQVSGLICRPASRRLF